MASVVGEPGRRDVTWTALLCDACGGAIAFDPGHEVVRCLFCAAVALVPVVADAPPGPPDRVVGFTVDATAAQLAFSRWVRASWWRPKALRSVGATMQPLWLPTWLVEAEVELHWAGLVDAPTRSGKRPRTGVDRRRAQALVPASAGVDAAELAMLRPFDQTTRAWTEDDRAIVCELPGLSEAAALARSVDRFVLDRLPSLSREEGLVGAGASARLVGPTATLAALPLWIGSFMYRGRSWRIVVNGNTAKVVGRAPIDRTKLAIVVLLVAVVAALFVIRCAPPHEPDPDAAHDRAALPGPDEHAYSGSVHALSVGSHGTTTSTYAPG
jgi:hypothetical protein